MGYSDPRIVTDAERQAWWQLFASVSAQLGLDRADPHRLDRGDSADGAGCPVPDSTQPDDPQTP